MGCLLKGIGIFAVLLIAFALLVMIASSSTSHAPSQSNISANSPSCTADNFSLTKTKVRTEYDYATLTGIVTNHCTSAVGVQLKWTAFNSDGTIAFSEDFWPASTTNIPPQTDYAFEMMASAPRGRWTYTVEPISINVW
jgi:hypothetical protein